MLSFLKSILISSILFFAACWNTQAQNLNYDSLRLQLIKPNVSTEEWIKNYDSWLYIALQINHDSLKTDLENLDTYRQSTIDSFATAVYYYNYAKWYTELTGDYQKGLVLTQQAKSIFTNGNHKPQHVICLCRIAFFKLWNEIGQDRSALNASVLNDYLLPALEIAKSTNDLRLKLIVNQWIGSYYSVSKNDNDKALNYFLNVEKLEKPLRDELMNIVTLASIGILYAENCNEIKSLEYLKKCEANKISTQYPYALGNLYRSIANYYLTCKKDFGNAILYADKAYTLAQKLKSPEYISLSQKRLYEIYKAMGNKDTAMLFLELYDTEVTKIARNKFEFAFSQYDIQNKEKLILQQKIDIQRKNLIFIFIAVAAILLSILLFVVYKLKKKDRINILKEKDEKNRIALDRAVRETEEDERKRISDNLHDSVVQNLVVAKMNMQSLQKEVLSPAEKENLINHIHNLLEESTIEIRRISHTIMPASFDNDGLGKVVKELEYKLINSNIRIEVFDDGDFLSLPKNLAIVAYRIIQECVQNALKHANASIIHITLIIDNGKLEATIEDNGIGFYQNKNNNNGKGLNSIRSRIENLHGNFHIESIINKGTSIFFQLPITKSNVK